MCTTHLLLVWGGGRENPQQHLFTHTIPQVASDVRTDSESYKQLSGSEQFGVLVAKG